MKRNIAATIVSECQCIDQQQQFISILFSHMSQSPTPLALPVTLRGHTTFSSSLVEGLFKLRMSGWSRAPLSMTVTGDRRWHQSPTQPYFPGSAAGISDFSKQPILNSHPCLKVVPHVSCFSKIAFL